jgi:hypothetical protein
VKKLFSLQGNYDKSDSLKSGRSAPTGRQFCCFKDTQFQSYSCHETRRKEKNFHPRQKLLCRIGRLQQGG